MTRHTTRLFATLLFGAILTGCTPAEIAWWSDPANEPTRTVVLAAYQTRPAATPVRDCFEAIDRHWPGNKDWARKVVRRESGGNPLAKNRRSTASGCFQLLRVHSSRFTRLGFSWLRDRFDARANVLVAWDLYREQGARPWRLTAY